MRLVNLVRQRSDLTLVPPAGLRLTLDGPIPAKPEERPAERAVKSKRPPSRHVPAPSWWTARARTGEVAPGFSKEEILRPAREDPRAPGGVFERVGDLLSDLLDQR